MPDFVGQTIRGYEIREKIGEGGSGAVYRAYQAAVDREVAVKVILPQYANEPEFARRFNNEARLVAHLEHPHIIPLHDYWQDATGAYLVMRYLRGGSLRQTLKRQGAISLAQTVRLLDQLGDALGAAHQAGVVHRDLKPDNILLDEHGYTYLSDFGIAKNLHWDDHLSTAGRIVGTPAYLSPEQIKGLPVGPQTDIYSLGFVLYEMLTGEHPYTESSMMLIMRHLQDPLPSLHEKRSDLPPQLDAIIQKATAKEPDDRYPDILSLVTDFRQAANLLSGAAIIIPVEPARPVPPVRRTPATPEARNRYNMLQNVHTFWIQGVLDNSLYGGRLVDLELQQNLLGNPWDTLMVKPGAGNQTLPPSTHIVELFDRLNGKLLILGEPGGGKTTMMLELAHDLLHRADNDDQHPIPVVLNLSSWSLNQKPLADWIVEELNSKYQAPKRTAKEWVEKDELLLLLDGLDEVTRMHRNACVEAINVYRQEHGFVDVVVCSRTEDYQELTTKLNLNGGVVLKPLTDIQVKTYLEGFGPDMNVLRLMLDDDDTLREMSRTPLILNVMTLAYQAITSEDLPRRDTAEARRKHLFDVYVQRMLQRRSGQPPYTEAQTIHYLSWLASRLKDSGQNIFLIERMQPSYLDDHQRRRYYRQLSAVIIVSQALAWGLLSYITGWAYGFSGALFGTLQLLAGAVWGWVFTSSYWKTWPVVLLAGLVFGLVYGGSALVPFGLQDALSRGIGTTIRYAIGYVGIVYMARQVGYDRSIVTIIDILRFSARAMKPWMAVIGIVTGVLLILTGGISVSSPDLLPAIIFAGSIGMAVILFLSGLTSVEVSRSSRPNQGIRNSLSNAFLMAFVFLIIPFLLVSLPIAFADSLLIGVGQALSTAVGSAYLGFLLFGGFTVIQHLILRRILQHDGQIPADYADFLDYATGLVFLRKVGGGYIFIHRYLMEYFAAMPNGDSR